MKTKVKQCLFGGALLGAGLCSNATAGDFQWGPANFSLVYTNPGPYHHFNTYGGWDEIETGSGQTATSTGNDFGLAMSAYTSYGYGSGFALAYHLDLEFTVTANMTANLNWDITNDNYNGGYGYSYADIFDSSYSSIFSMNGTTPTGNMDIQLLVGQTYHFWGQIISGPGAQGLSFFNMSSGVAVVPLPPAAFGGLAMLGGLCAYRRVRRRS